MTKETFRLFRAITVSFLYCEELNIRIRHADFDCCKYIGKERLYIVEQYPNSPKIITCYMTEHMIIKAFKNNEFLLDEFQRGI